MRVRWNVLIAVLFIGVLASPFAIAGAKLKINDEAEIDLGFRLQSLIISTDSDLDGDGAFESFQDFKIRRGRIRLNGKINDHVSMFLQTEIGSGDGDSGLDMRLIDAFITLKRNDWSQLLVGVNMAPANRQNTTSSGALMTIDRPGTAYKSITWGSRALHTFSNRTDSGADSGFRGEVDVRDLGLTYFGSGDVGDNAHLKFYLGVYDGIQVGLEDSERYTARVQLNFFDSEPGYYNLSTYLGKKKTVGVGLSYDTQSNVLGFPGLMTDYSYLSADVFADIPSGNGAFTAEGGYASLDFDDTPVLINSQGDGMYAQLGYLFNGRWQPWIGYETWDSDDPTNLGNLDNLRLGVSYFIAGHNANIKLGYESYSVDVPFTGTEDSISSIVLGFYTTY